MSTAHILLIDRHPDWLKFAEETLVRGGYTVKAVSDFDEASQCCFEEEFDLIFIGLDQAESHLGSLKDLAKKPDHPRRFVVMFPLRQTFDRVRIVWKAGAYDVVDKPYQSDALLKMVADEIDEARRRNGLAAAASDSMRLARDHAIARSTSQRREESGRQRHKSLQNLLQRRK